MSLIFHTCEIKKTYIFVSHCFFGDNVEEIKPILGEQTWKTTFFYLVTLSVVFIVTRGVFILTN